MELLEYKSNAWGQKVLEGVSWDLVWIFAGVGLIVIVIHSLYVVWRKKIISQSFNETSSGDSVDG
jgi:hypothetical protein